MPKDGKNYGEFECCSGVSSTVFLEGMPSRYIDLLYFENLPLGNIDLREGASVKYDDES